MSSGPNAYSSRVTANSRVTFAWLTATPLGWPVEPEV
jgi:hypothetical protein